MHSPKSSGLKYAIPLAVGLVLAPEIWDRLNYFSMNYFPVPAIEYAQKNRKKNVHIKRDVNKDGKEDLVYLVEEIELGATFYRLMVREYLGDGKFKDHMIQKFACHPPEDIEFGEDNSLAYTEIRSLNTLKFMETVERRERSYKGGFAFGKPKTVWKKERRFY